jgi:hypothetical protein
VKHGFGKHCQFSESQGPESKKCHSESRKCDKEQRKCDKEQRKCDKEQRKCHRKYFKEQRKCIKGRDCRKTDNFSSEFIQDVNVTDGTFVAPGALVKRWLLKNSGASKWPEGCKLIFLRGDRDLLGEREEFEVTLAEPGQTVEVSCPIVVPAKNGRYSAYFQLADKDRAIFGHRFWIEFVVKEDEKKQLLSQVPQVDKVETKKPAQGEVEDTKSKSAQGLSSPIPEIAKPSTIPEATKPSTIPEAPKPSSEVPKREAEP